MFYLNLTLQAWLSDNFDNVFKQELATIDSSLLPLQQGLTYSSVASADKLSVTILNTKDQTDYLCIKAGLFYTGIISGCNCADDPSPVDEINEYCEVLFKINKKTANTTVSLVTES